MPRAEASRSVWAVDRSGLLLVALRITAQQCFVGVDDSNATQLQLTGGRGRASIVIPVLDLSGAPAGRCIAGCSSGYAVVGNCCMCCDLCSTSRTGIESQGRCHLVQGLQTQSCGFHAWPAVTQRLVRQVDAQGSCLGTLCQTPTAVSCAAPWRSMVCLVAV
jgi:hypothetical protein